MPFATGKRGRYRRGMAKDIPPQIVNVDEIPESEGSHGEHYGAAHKCLTPSMLPRGGKLGVNQIRVSRGRSMCPSHFHTRSDEAFFVLSGRGLLRYGEELREIRAGDCISCPAGTKTAHQIHNPHHEDLIYLAIGPFDPDDVVVYPDSGKVSITSLGQRGKVLEKDYFDDEPDPPRIVAMTKTKA